MTSSGVWRNWGRKANIEYIPIPNSRDTRFTVHTVGMRIIFMSISGLSLRASAQTQIGRTTAARANRPTVMGEPQPQTWPWLTASRSATSQVDISRALETLIRPGARSGDSGTKKCAVTAASPVRIIGSQNSQW